MTELVDLGMVHPSLARLERPAGTRLPGLSRALGARFGIDPLLIRVALILLVPVGGVGVIAYGWGVLLTVRAGDAVPPIGRYLPGFATWPARSQWLVIAVSSVVAAGLLSQLAPISIVPTLLLALLIVAFRRRRLPAPARQEQGPEPLPVVDLYAPETMTDTAASPAMSERTPGSWWGAVGVTLIGIGCAVIAAVLTASILVSAAVGIGAAGVTTLMWALLVRSRRLPTTFLLVLLVSAGLLGTLGAAKAVAPGNPIRTGTELSYTHVAESVTIDLRNGFPDGATTIRIAAVASEVLVLLPAAPVDIDTQETLSQVRYPRRLPTSSAQTPEATLHLTVTATASRVTVEYPE